MNEYKRISNQEIAHLASLLNAAHLLAEESDQRLQELAARYPDALTPEILRLAQSGTLNKEACQTADFA
jgi:hypothetical protein